jgi:exoribonuclease-2
VETHDVDDAISVTTGDDGARWLHVHVADVTSLVALQRDTPFDRMMLRRATSLYLPHAYFGMMPPALTAFAGLDQQRNGRRECRALTFSYRLAADGSIAASRITPTMLHEVQRVSYEQVEAALAGESIDALSASDVELLRELDAAALLRHSWRGAQGSLSMTMPKPKV